MQGEGEPGLGAPDCADPEGLERADPGGFEAVEADDDEDASVCPPPGDTCPSSLLLSSLQLSDTQVYKP